MLTLMTMDLSDILNVTRVFGTVLSTRIPNILHPMAEVKFISFSS